MPLTRMRLRVGVICGMRADTAGIWMPAPADRMAIVRKMSQTASYPAIMMSASVRVDAAIPASAIMMRYLRLWRSAQTPPKMETTACGRKPNSAASIMMTPDW